MRSRILVVVMAFAIVLAFSSVLTAQQPGGNRNGGQTDAGHIPLPSNPPPDGWHNCPRCDNNDDRAKAWTAMNIDGHAFNPKDLSGVWSWGVGNTVDDALNATDVPAGCVTDVGVIVAVAQGGDVLMVKVTSA